MSKEPWWTKQCPACTEQNRIQHQEETIRYCDECKFQWSTELNYALLLVMAVDHNRARMATKT